MEHPDGRSCLELHVITGTPYGKLSSIPFDYEYIVLIQGTNIIYCPDPHIGEGLLIQCMN